MQLQCPLHGCISTSMDLQAVLLTSASDHALVTIGKTGKLSSVYPKLLPVNLFNARAERHVASHSRGPRTLKSWCLWNTEIFCTPNPPLFPPEPHAAGSLLAAPRRNTLINKQRVQGERAPQLLNTRLLRDLGRQKSNSSVDSRHSSSFPSTLPVQASFIPQLNFFPIKTRAARNPFSVAAARRLLHARAKWIPSMLTGWVSFFFFFEGVAVAALVCGARKRGPRCAEKCEETCGEKRQTRTPF